MNVLEHVRKHCNVTRKKQKPGKKGVAFINSVQKKPRDIHMEICSDSVTGNMRFKAILQHQYQHRRRSNYTGMGGALGNRGRRAQCSSQPGSSPPCLCQVRSLKAHGQQPLMATHPEDAASTRTASQSQGHGSLGERVEGARLSTHIWEGSQENVGHAHGAGRATDPTHADNRSAP